MGRKVCVSLVILALVLAGPDAKAAAAYSVDQAVSSSSSSSSRLEDEMAPVLAVVTTVDLEAHGDILRGIGTGALDPIKLACRPPCAVKGLPYTGRGCNPYNHCG